MHTHGLSSTKTACDLLLFLNICVDATFPGTRIPKIYGSRSVGARGLSFAMSAEKLKSRQEPSIIVAGGGPAGVFTGLLLGRRGLDVKVFEKQKDADVLTDRSYFINVNGRGQEALDAAGVLDAVRDVSALRYGTTMHQADGSIRRIPKEPPGLVLSRPRLSSVLADVLVAEGKAQFVRNKCIERVEPTDDHKLLKVIMSDGSVEYATHVVGADGKWSKVRASAAEFEKTQTTPSFTWEMGTMDSWGVRLDLHGIPEGWDRDDSHILFPKWLMNNISMTWRREAPETYSLITNTGLEGLYDAWVRLHPINLEDYPELAPADDAAPGKWDVAIPSSAAWSAGMRRLIETEYPTFAALMKPEDYATSKARQGLRAQWIDIQGRYDSMHGRVALIGDAAHCMPPSFGEGANAALESGFLLDQALGDAGIGGKDKVTDDQVTEAFMRYGASRPLVVKDIVRRSAHMK